MRKRVPFFCKKKLIKLFKKIELQVSTGDGENSVLPHKIRARFLDHRWQRGSFNLRLGKFARAEHMFQLLNEITMRR